MGNIEIFIIYIFLLLILLVLYLIAKRKHQGPETLRFGTWLRQLSTGRKMDEEIQKTPINTSPVALGNDFGNQIEIILSSIYSEFEQKTIKIHSEITAEMQCQIAALKLEHHQSIKELRTIIEKLENKLISENSNEALKIPNDHLEGNFPLKSLAITKNPEFDTRYFGILDLMQAGYTSEEIVERLSVSLSEIEKVRTVMSFD